MDYQWYPGHMTKAVRMMKENISLVDLVIEIVDARIPVSSRNPDIDSLGKGKSRIIILSKSDLADPVKTQEFCSYFENKGILVIPIDSRNAKSTKQIKALIQEACKEKKARDLKRGIKNRPVRAMVCGIPNVGKSTFINSLCGRASAKTGNKPGVTKGKQWISLGNEVQLLDTPGILWPKFEDQTVGIRLALAGSIREEILDEMELAGELIRNLMERYPKALSAKYGELTTDHAEEIKERMQILSEIALNRNLLSKGGEADLARAAHLVLDDFKNGRTGRITLDDVPEGESNVKTCEIDS